MIAVCAFSFTACKEIGQTGNEEKGLLIKKIDEVYTIYDFVDDGSFDDALRLYSRKARGKACAWHRCLDGDFCDRFRRVTS